MTARPGVLAAGAAALVAVLVGAPLLLVPTLVTLVWVVVVLLLRRRVAIGAARRREWVLDAVESMSGELHAGQALGRSLERAAEVWPELVPVSTAHRLGAPVSGALREVARRPGAQALHQVASAWALCSSTGAGLAGALDQVMVTVRAEHEVLLAVSSELAAARATARLIGVLPLLVLGIGSGIGTDPWSFLLSTRPGLVCLWAGVTSAVVGVMWIERISDYAQGAPR